MEIVDYLKPKFVLMENVVDILKFAGGYLAKYAVSRLISMNYQARLGMMAAGCYGLPQFRMRVFLWGAHPREVSLIDAIIPCNFVFMTYQTLIFQCSPSPNFLCLHITSLYEAIFLMSSRYVIKCLWCHSFLLSQDNDFNDIIAAMCCGLWWRSSPWSWWCLST